jgi:hypothetical protein
MIDMRSAAAFGRAWLITLACLGLMGCGQATDPAGVATTAPAPPLARMSFAPDADAAPVDWLGVSPVLERRCVVCHGCYDAPCQLLLSSPEGAERGASGEVVYESSRLTPAEPTRLFTDEGDTAGWRKRGFFSVLDHEQDQASLMEVMLALGRSRPFPAGEPLPDDFDLDISRKLSCPDDSKLDDYLKDHPDGGMPYGMAPIPENEWTTLVGWLQSGAPSGMLHDTLDDELAGQVAQLEAFLNGASLEEKIVGRYVYEHLVFAHVAFRSRPTGPFFRVIRSRTPPGSPPDEIATRRPYDSPGQDPFWYRLEAIRSAIVHKTHILYWVDEARIARFRELFAAGDWKASRLPSYEAKSSANPFVTFGEIPARARYEFLLDDAAYFVMTFIRGPVCRGQVAVDVIRDRFFVAMADPDHDLFVNHPAALEEAAPLLSLPAEYGSGGKASVAWIRNNKSQRDYLKLRRRLYDEIDPDRLGPDLDYIWDGDGENPNAYLTVFRNHDNATVLKGFIGAVPKTAWVMDFPILERIYYDLVAGFDVFGSLAHQVSTRLYMDHLRMQSENLFLLHLPQESREGLRDSWYKGAKLQLDYFLGNDISKIHHGTRIEFFSDDPVAELIEQLMLRDPELTRASDPINRCLSSPCGSNEADAFAQRSDAQIARIASVKLPIVAALPELMYAVVRSGEGQRARVYTIFHDRMHTNVAFMFGEDRRLEPEDDILTILPGVLGSYPNFIFDVGEAELEAFVTALREAKGEAELTDVVRRYGVRRTSPEFWSTIDWIQAEQRRQSPAEAGILDLNRYSNL